MVSCNPRVLRQDATLLHAAGYRLERLTVIDQFLWSSGVESVAVFVKPRR
jgi:23S rRNA (uracil1939-C5)-methyltransferase